MIEERVVDVQHEALLSGARWIHDLDRKLHGNTPQTTRSPASNSYHRLRCERRTFLTLCWSFWMFSSLSRTPIVRGSYTKSSSTCAHHTTE